MKENTYIQYRKIKAGLNKLAFYICRIFPIEKNLITVCTFEGKGGFGCNPKYIIKQLHETNPDIKIVWLVNSDIINLKDFPEYVIKKKNTLWRRAYWLSTAKVWIDNYRKPYGTIKRKGQYYINTWHGTVGFKSIGLWRGNAFSRMAYLVSKNDSDMIDEVITDSKWCDEVFHKGLLYDKPFMKIGYPRCDILFGDRKSQKSIFLSNKGLPQYANLLIYAPTFREKNNNGSRSVSAGVPNINFNELIACIEKRFGGEWYIVFRLHPQLANTFNDKNVSEIFNCDKIVDASNDPDMYEVLAACDALITDYSSVAMEAGFMEIPVFLYTDDLKEYMNSRGGQQWIFNEESGAPIKNNREMMPNLSLELPYSLAQNMDELIDNINDFNMNDYHRKIITFKEQLELVFDGKASERAAELVIDMLHR